METKQRTLFNAPEGATVTPTVLIMIKYYWAKGETIDKAWENLKGYSGLTIPKMKKDAHLIYAAFDVEFADDEERTVKTYVNEMGSVCYHRDYPAVLIHQRKP